MNPDSKPASILFLILGLAFIGFAKSDELKELGSETRVVVQSLIR